MLFEMHSLSVPNFPHARLNTYQALSSKTAVSAPCHQEILDVIAQDKTQRSMQKEAAPRAPNGRGHVDHSSKSTIMSEPHAGAKPNRTFWDIVLIVMILVAVVVLYKYMSRPKSKKPTSVRGRKGRARPKKRK